MERNRLGFLHLPQGKSSHPLFGIAWFIVSYHAKWRLKACVWVLDKLAGVLH